MVYINDDKLMETFLPAVLGVLREPKRFFREMSGSCYTGSILLVLAVTMVSVVTSLPFYGPGMMFLFPVVWLFTMVALKLSSLYLSWAVKKYSSLRLPRRHPFTIVAYASIPLMFVYIPIVGWFASMWSLYLIYVGATEHGGLSFSKTLLIVILPTILPVVVFIVTVFLAFPQLHLI